MPGWGDQCSAAVLVFGTQNEDGRTFVEVQLTADDVPVHSVGDALRLGRALIAAASKVQDIGGQHGRVQHSAT